MFVCIDESITTSEGVKSHSSEYCSMSMKSLISALSRSKLSIRACCCSFENSNNFRMFLSSLPTSVVVSFPPGNDASPANLQHENCWGNKRSAHGICNEESLSQGRLLSAVSLQLRLLGSLTKLGFSFQICFHTMLGQLRLSFHSLVVKRSSLFD